jgi:uncharacterized protein YbaP (TraB family)
MTMLVLLLVFLTAATGRAESSVWEIKGPKATVYLAGSSHVLRASDHPLPAEFDIAYARSRRIVFEAPLAEMEKPLYLQKLLAAAVYPDGSTLKDHVSPTLWNKVQKFCRERNHDCDKFYIFRPWMFSIMLTMQELGKIGVEQAYGVDQVFHEKAKKDGKSLGALETVDEQIGYLTMLDGGMGEQQVNETLDELKDLDARLADILKAWRMGDEAGIAAFSLRELQNYPQLYQTLIVNRNQKWIKDIEREISGPVNTMIIVGVAHLAGADSVVDLLRKRGHKVMKVQK